MSRTRTHGIIDKQSNGGHHRADNPGVLFRDRMGGKVLQDEAAAVEQEDFLGARTPTKGRPTVRWTTSKQPTASATTATARPRAPRPVDAIGNTSKGVERVIALPCHLLSGTSRSIGEFFRSRGAFARLGSMRVRRMLAPKLPPV